jgi:hypothetical protein
MPRSESKFSLWSFSNIHGPSWKLKKKNHRKKVGNCI